MTGAPSGWCPCLRRPFREIHVLIHLEQDRDGNLVGTLEMPMAVGIVGGD